MYDSGATASLIDPKVIKQAGLSSQVIKGSSYELTGAFTGTRIAPYGEIIVPFYINKQRYSHNFIIADLAGDNEIILGQDFFLEHRSKSINNYGCKKMFLNGKEVILTTTRLVENKGESIKAVPYAQQPRGLVNVEVKPYRKQFLPPKSRLLVKVSLPNEANAPRIMLESLNLKKIDFVDQLTSVRQAQNPGKHLGSGCRGTKCAGCASYKFAYLEVVNLTNKGVTLTKKHPIALASNCKKISKADIKSINTATLIEPDYKAPKRVAELIKMLDGKVPDCPDQTRFVESIIKDYPQAFHLDGEMLSVTDKMMHHINYEGPPLWYRQRPIPQAKTPGLLKTIDKLCLHGSIGASDSDFNFQTVPVYKNSSHPDEPRPIRLTVDLSPLNRLTARDRVSIPTWDEIMSKLKGSMIFSKIDLKSAFHQIKLDEISQKKTAFSIGSRRFQFLTCPQGLANSPSSLVRLMTLVLGRCDQFVIPYMDDILIFSPDVQTHRTHLNKVFECLSEAKLQVSLEKSVFFTTSVEFLGFVVSKEGVKPDPSKLDALLKPGKTPQNLYDVRSLMGAFNVYRRHIPNFSDITRPITNLTKGLPVSKGRSIKITWTPEAQLALDKLKKATRDQAVLAFPDFKKEFYIFSDASDLAVGGSVMQEEDGCLRPISFYSKVLSPAETRYCTTDREALGIFSILDANKSWLLGQRLCVMTDHRPLKFILTSTSENPRLLRWRYLLQEFNPHLFYLPGKSNTVADYMSRQAFSSPGKTKIPMQDRFVAATESSSLPSGVPETFCPPIVNISNKNVGELAQLDGPIILLCDTMSPQPLGPVKAIADQLPHVKQYFSRRKPQKDNDSFCTEETANTMGTFVRINDTNKLSPDVYLCFNVLSHTLPLNDKDEIMRIRELASPELRKELTSFNPQERNFYAQLAFEQLLFTWENKPPAAKLYIVSHTEARDPGKESLSRLIQRFAYGCYKREMMPILLSGRCFKSYIPRTVNAIDTSGEEQLRNIARKACVTQDYPWTVDMMLAAQNNDKQVSALKRLLTEKTGKDDDGTLLSNLPIDQFCVASNQLVYRIAKNNPKGFQRQLFVPETMHKLALEYCHHYLGLHPGITKTAYMVSTMFFWPRAYKDVVEFVRNCITCQKIKPKRVDDVMHGSTFLPILPYDCLSIDLVTPGQKTKGGHKHVLTVVCLVSKYAWFIPAKSRQAGHLADLLINNIFRHFGLPRTISHDQAGEFTGNLFSNMLKELGIRQHKIVAYNPRSQGVVERLNQTLLQLLRAVYLEYPLKWDAALPMCQSSYNSSYHRSLNNTPYFCFFYRDNHMPYSILYPSIPHEDTELKNRVSDAQIILEMTRSSIAQTQKTRLQNVNINKKNSIEVGDIVFCAQFHVNKKDYKILERWIGPFRILILEGNCATVKSFRTGRISRVSLRNVKLIHHSALTKTDHPSVDEPFPVHGDNDFPNDFPHEEVRSHKDVTFDPEVLPDVVTKLVTDSENQDDSEERTLRGKHSVASKVLGRRWSAESASSSNEASKINPPSVRKLAGQSEVPTQDGGFTQTEVQSKVADKEIPNGPISLRTRSRTKEYANFVSINLDEDCFLYIDLPMY